VRLQSAIVVGPPGEEVHCDQLGRVKLRFPGTRKEDHPDGAGASNTDRDSAWVRVASHWAGDRWGSISLPRVGDEVLVEFLAGDPDKPIVVGRVHGGRAVPPAFSHQGELPGNRFVAGIKSKEVRGTRCNQLRLDDTTGQISAQLQSSHAASQLNLGKLSHPKATAESEDRGEGFELRTDQWGAVRACEGLLVSTHKQDKAQGEHLDVQPAKQQLEGNQNNAKALSEVAKNQQTDEIESVDQLKEFAEQIQDKIAQFKKSLLFSEK
jgi:type VI secretion system secreted protein VgrG